MDAHAHLISLGWAGPGHSLNSRPHKGRSGLAYDPKQERENGNGLIKPLLISQKKNTFGIGKKAHEPAAGNDWWLKGFETALSNVGKSENERTSGTATPEQGRSANGYTGKHVGLYAFFVKGGQMEGTISSQSRKEQRLTEWKKRKSDGLDVHGGSPASSEGDASSNEARLRKKRRPKESTAEFEQIGAFMEARDKDERRRRRRQKADALEEFQQAGEFFEARSSRRKASPSRTPHVDSAAGVDATANVTEDSAEERRRRRRERKAKKKFKALHADSDAEDHALPITTSVDKVKSVMKVAADDSMARAVRKAEKKRRHELERN